MKPDLRLEQGTILQLNPETCRDQSFAGCLIIVTSAHRWGVDGFVQERGGASNTQGKQAHCRARWDELEQLSDGMAVWMPSDPADHTAGDPPVAQDATWQRTEAA